MTDVVRFIKLTDCAPLAKIFQEQVRCFCYASVPLRRLWVLCFSWLLDSALAGVGQTYGLHTSVGALCYQVEMEVPALPGLLRCPLERVWVAWCQLARLEVRVPCLASAGGDGGGQFVLQ